jgi:hypothetical protein
MFYNFFGKQSTYLKLTPSVMLLNAKKKAKIFFCSIEPNNQATVSFWPTLHNRRIHQFSSAQLQLLPFVL